MKWWILGGVAAFTAAAIIYSQYEEAQAEETAHELTDEEIMQKLKDHKPPLDEAKKEGALINAQYFL
jgi:hypothetical protein